MPPIKRRLLRGTNSFPLRFGPREEEEEYYYRIRVNPFSGQSFISSHVPILRATKLFAAHRILSASVETFVLFSEYDGAREDPPLRLVSLATWKWNSVARYRRGP